MLPKQRNKIRPHTGASIVEFAAALALGLPLVIALIYVVLETSVYFSIKTNLDVGARTAARQLAILYGQTNGSPTAAQVNAVLSQCMIPGFIATTSQFSSPNYVPGSGSPPGPGTVTIVVSYPGSSGLPPFPNPDPLNLRSKVSTIYSSATFAVE